MMPDQIKRFIELVKENQFMRYLVAGLLFCMCLALGGHPKPANDGHLKTGQWKTSAQDIETGREDVSSAT